MFAKQKATNLPCKKQQRRSYQTGRRSKYRIRSVISDPWNAKSLYWMIFCVRAMSAPRCLQIIAFIKLYMIDLRVHPILWHMPYSRQGKNSAKPPLLEVSISKTWLSSNSVRKRPSHALSSSEHNVAAPKWNASVIIQNSESKHLLLSSGDFCLARAKAQPMRALVQVLRNQ